MKFSIIAGNPPFSDFNDISSKMPLWCEFSTTSYSLLEKNGIIGFITPSSWMSPKNSLFELMKKGNLKSVSCNISHYFPDVSSTFTYWILQKSVYDGSTKFNDLIINLNDCPYLVEDTNSLSIHQKVMFAKNKKLKIKADGKASSADKSNISNNKTDLFPYEIFHTNAITFWCKKQPKDLTKSKVIFTTSGYLKPFYDEGKIGVSECSRYCLVKNKQEGIRLVSILSSKLFQYIVTTAKWSGYINGTVLTLLPALDLTETWSDENLYTYFKLTDEEIKEVEKYFGKIDKITGEIENHEN